MSNIRNYMEMCVDDMIKQVIDSLNVCKCEKCLMDIKAIALNSIPTKYVVTEEGQVYTKLNILYQQFDVDIISAITKAANIVKESPRHEHGKKD